MLAFDTTMDHFPAAIDTGAAPAPVGFQGVPLAAFRSDLMLGLYEVGGDPLEGGLSHENLD